MRSFQILIPALALLTACQAGGPGGGTPKLAAGDPAYRASLFTPLLSLEGRWQLVGTEDMVEFTTSSAGTAIREVMFPGMEHEMTNMYTLNGDSVVMTHYCAAGNQPHMRAEVLGNGRLDFQFVDVQDLGAADEHYMGEMSLVWVDDDRVEQHWRSFIAGEHQPEDDMVFELVRVDG